jgi:MFS family permease
MSDTLASSPEDGSNTTAAVTVKPRMPPSAFLVGRGIPVVVAALAMVATLPGRTHGLGLVTKPLLEDLHLGQVPYAAMNLWATLLGAAFCLPCGWLLDRLGTRLMLTLNLLALGGVVVWMSRVQGDWVVSLPLPFADGLSIAPTEVMMDLFLLVLLTRGLGQSALSVVSLTLVGHAAGRRPGLTIGIYSALVAVGFTVAFTTIKHVLEEHGVDWRTLWGGIGVTLLVAAPLAHVALSLAARSAGPTDQPKETASSTESASWTFGQALRSPAFWVFGLASSLYLLVVSGISLFNQSIQKERHFDREVFLSITAVTPLIGLASNLATGWLATRWSMGKLLGLAMIVLASALLAFPFVTTLFEVYLYAAALGIAGGMVTVLFFAFWRQAYGTTHLGKIQGAAQLLTVVASAFGPLVLALGKSQAGSYTPMFRCLAAITGVFAVLALVTPLPRAGMSDETKPGVEVA